MDADADAGVEHEMNCLGETMRNFSFKTKCRIDDGITSTKMRLFQSHDESKH